MQDGWERRRADWDAGRAVARSRARWAIYALVATAACRVFVLAGHEIAEPSVVAVGAFAELALLVLTAVAFLRWLAHTISLASAMSPTPLAWSASSAVWTFFTPIAGLWRPYQVIRDLHAVLAPSGVPEPAPQPVLDGSGGYRNVPMKSPPPPRALPHVSIGAWWGAFLATRLLGRVDTPAMDLLTTVLTVASAALAVFVVRAIDARFAERYRRLHHASDAELESWHLRA
ncbi:MAG TPA: DUF4328 domain-containing protein [Polyangiaceae bacterium]|jgi:hypothetical protein